MAEKLNILDLPYEMKDSKGKNPELSRLLGFIGLCMFYSEKSNSQCFQDVFATWVRMQDDLKEFPVSKSLKNVMVDIGSGHPTEGSNSKFLSETGWTVLAYDANPAYRDLYQDSKVNFEQKCVWKESGKSLRFNIYQDPALSTIEGYGTEDEHSSVRVEPKTHWIQSISISDLFKNIYEEYPSIDFVSLDTEGSEFDILESWFKNDLSNHNKILGWCIEHNSVKEKRDKILDLMTSKGYTRIFMEVSRWDDFYILSELL